MKSFVFLFFCSIFVICLVAAGSDQTLNYRLGENEYAIVMIFGEEVKEEEVKQLAVKKAAEKARSEHFRYFTVEKQGQVQAVLSGKDASSSQPSNMYYDLRQSDNFGRERYSDEQMPSEEARSAYRIIFKCYMDKPNKEAIDVCTIISCES